MRTRRVRRIVASLLRGEWTESPTHRAALERDLLDRHQEIYGHRSVDRGHSTRQSPRFRFAWAAVAALILLVVTGEAIPGSYSVSVGWLLSWDVASPSASAPAVSQLVSALEGSHTAEQISVSIDQRSEGGFRLHLILFGAQGPADGDSTDGDSADGATTEDVVLQMQRRYPDLAAVPVRTEELVGTFKTSLVRQIGRAVFAIEIDPQDVERARAQILTKLVAAGNTASRVEFSERDGARQIEIDIED